MRKISRVLQTVRDVPLLVFSFLLAASSYGKWVEDLAFLIVFPIAAVLLVLTAVNLALVAKNVKRKVYFYANSIAQVFLLGLLGGLFQPALIFFFLNLLVLATLGEKKTAEYRMLHPPVPITRRYRLVLLAGTLLLLVSMLLPWAVAEGKTLTLFGVYAGIASHSGLPSVALQPLQVVLVLLSLALPPISILLGGLGMIRRRLSAVSGALAVVAGAAVISVFGGDAGVGGYGLVLGGALDAFGFVRFRGQKGTGPQPSSPTQ